MKRVRHISFCISASIVLLVSSSCSNDKVDFNFKTENIIIIVIDGPRYSETWGDQTLANIPFQASLKSQGLLYTNIYNLGETKTVPGHVAITTGSYENIDNGGQELPSNPSIFQRWMKTFSKDKLDAWIITSKDKLEILANCSDNNWESKYMPSTDCGIDGLGSGYRHDSLTLQVTFDVLNDHHPELLLINFREPDFSAHQNDWNAYLNQIAITDNYIQQIWNYIESDPVYAGKTTLLITNDHGRHLDNVADGFAGHGDNCSGCQKISLLAIGPDFKKNKEISTQQSQVDINATLCKLLKLEPAGDGLVLQELFK